MVEISKALREHADTAALVADILYGDSFEISKALSTEEKRKNELLQTRLSQASNAVGLAAGVAATPSVARDVSTAYRRLRPLSPEQQSAARLKGITRAKNFLNKHPKGSVGYKVADASRKFSRSKNTPKVALGLAGANLALQGVNIGGDALTNVVLRRTKKMQEGTVQKSRKGDFEVFCEIAKTDTDKRQVFGWASISKKDGVTVLDHQGDTIETDELERAAYDYMLRSRKGGHEHQKTHEGPLHVADVIESFVITDEKKKAMGLPDSTPEGWWVGMKVNDDKVWELAKSGELAGFSIHGSGRRVPLEL